jgi:hypothetical protein
MPALINRPAYQLFVGIDIAASTFAAVWTVEGQQFTIRARYVTLRTRNLSDSPGR